MAESCVESMLDTNSANAAVNAGDLASTSSKRGNLGNH